MNNSQRAILSVYIPTAFLIVILDHICRDSGVVQTAAYGAIATLFLIAMATRGKSREQKLMTAAIFFASFGDLFLVLDFGRDWLPFSHKVLGGMSFMAGYSLLAAAYFRNIRIRPYSVMLALAVAGFHCYSMSVFTLHLKGLEMAGVAVFGLFISTMAWTALCAPFAGYYRRGTSIAISLSSLLMVACDLSVGMDSFVPYAVGYWGVPVADAMRVSYITGWALLTAVVADDTPFAKGS